jgi:hypothetical protein
MAAQSGTELITAVAPGLYPRLPQARYVIARRKGPDLESQFASVIEPNSGTSLIKQVERLPVTGPPGEIPAVALNIRRQDGATDLIYSSGDTAVRSAGDCTFAGRFICAHLKAGKLTTLEFVGARQFQGLGQRFQSERDAWEGPVTAVDYASNAVTTTAPLPTDGSLNGQIILVSNPRYSRNTAYRITRVEAAGGATRIRLDATLLLGKGVVGAIKDATTLTSLVPHEYARTVNGKSGSGFFRGKRIRTAAGASARIASVRYGRPMMLTLESTQGFHPGEAFVYDDVQPSDQFSILLVAMPTSR